MRFWSPPITSLLLAVLLGALAALGGALVVGRLLIPQLQAERSERQAAHDRLYTAWKDGYQVPEPMPDAADPPIQMPAELREFCDQWDDALGRATWERRALRMMESGYSAEAVLRQFNAETA